MEKRKERRKTLNYKLKLKRAEQKTFLRESLVNAKKELKLLHDQKKSSRNGKPMVIAISEIRNNDKHNRSKLKKNCQNELLTKLGSFLPSFHEDQLKSLETLPLKKGVFGEIGVCHIQYLGVTCARKTIRGTMADLRAEALVMQHVSGHPCFPFFYGLLSSRAILMEYVSGNKHVISPSMTLRHSLGNNLLKKTWFKICREIVDGLTFLHEKGILHNDLHGDNILIRSSGSPCIIDFGKATLADCPMIYNITAGSKEQKMFNKIHLHLAHELRNIPPHPKLFQQMYIR